MIALMTFKYYFVSIFLGVLFSIDKIKVEKRYLLFVFNLLMVGAIYFSAKKHFILLILHLTVIFFGANILIKNKNKIFFTFLLMISLLPLLFFKYTVPKDFLLNVFPLLNSLLKPLSLLGVSFYTFKLVSILTDVIYERVDRKILYVDLFNYSLFFPCLLSGPLDRYNRFLKDVEVNEVSSELQFNGLYRIALGVFKKIVVADILWNFSNDSYNNLELLNLPTYKIVIGQYVYCIMLYFDFSGYSDVAIGISNLFGIHTPENFNHPFKSRNIQVFWNNWHMSFMHWLRDYLFFPIQKLLLTLKIDNVNLNNTISYVFIFLVAGLWHGEGKNFIYYGIFHGLGFLFFFAFKNLMEKKLNKEQRKAYLKNIYVEYLGRFVTFNFFTISLFFFIDKKEALGIIIGRILR